MSPSAVVKKHVGGVLPKPLTGPRPPVHFTRPRHCDPRVRISLLAPQFPRWKSFLISVTSVSLW